MPHVSVQLLLEIIRSTVKAITIHFYGAARANDAFIKIEMLNNYYTVCKNIKILIRYVANNKYFVFYLSHPDYF